MRLRRTSTLDALGARGQHGGSESTQVGVQLRLGERAFAKRCVQHTGPVRPAEHNPQPAALQRRRNPKA